MFKIFFLLLFGLSFSVKAISVEEKLAQVNYFSLGYNGFVAKKSEGEFIYEKILSLENNQEIFIRVMHADNTTNESKLYSACGLWSINKKRLDEFIPGEGFVTVLKGDILRRENFKDYFYRIKERGCF